MLLDHGLCYQTDSDPVSTKVAKNLSDVIPLDYANTTGVIR